MLTLEVLEELHRLYPDCEANPVYGFERGLQGPILEMMQRGFLVDELARQSAMADLEAKLAKLASVLQRLAMAVWDKPLNAASPLQLRQFFYEAMQLPEQHRFDKGVRKVSTNREAMEKLEVYFHARPIVATILAIRDNAKLLSVLRSKVDPDGRIRTQYNIGGTETGRLASSASAFETGTNLQNITPSLRRIFIADPGWKLCVIDYEQSESRDVGFLCGDLFDDWSYLDACESGDLHTETAKLIWPQIVVDRATAEATFYRFFTYRDMSKRGGHGTTYLGTPFTMARHLKVPVPLMKSFQAAFFGAYPCIPRWHVWTKTQLQTKSYLETPFGFRRHFFGRLNDDTTLREAIAFIPQSMTAHRTNLATVRHWRAFGTATQLLANTHDSITFQYREEDEARIIPEALSLMSVPLHSRGRTYSCPGEAKVGWNWMVHHNPAKPLDPKRNIFNPNGLIKWKGSDSRHRLVGLQQPVL